jgi:hypothetical protein
MSNGSDNEKLIEVVTDGDVACLVLGERFLRGELINDLGGDKLMLPSELNLRGLFKPEG